MAPGFASTSVEDDLFAKLLRSEQTMANIFNKPHRANAQSRTRDMLFNKENMYRSDSLRALRALLSL